MPRLLMLGMLMLMLPQASWAKKVYSPHVEKGSIEFETQTDIVRDSKPAENGSVKQQFELAAGLTDWWSTGVYAVYRKPGNRSQYDYTATKWENIFVLPRLNALGLDWGIYTEYVWAAPSSGAPDAVEGKLLLEDRGERWRHTANIILKQKLGSGAGSASLGYAWRSHYAFSFMELALEAYGSFGEFNQFLPGNQQSHLIGPVATLKLLDDVEFELGWLMDVNAGPAYGDFKFNIEVEF